MLNQKTVNLELKRIDLCDLMLACTVIADMQKENGMSATKWEALHDKLESIIDSFDKTQGF